MFLLDLVKRDYFDVIFKAGAYAFRSTPRIEANAKTIRDDIGVKNTGCRFFIFNIPTKLDQYIIRLGLGYRLV